MDLVSGNDANKFKIYFLADLPLRGLATEDTISRSKILGVMSHLTIVKDAFLDLVTFLLGGGFGATKSLFLDILLAGGISSTSIILFLVDLHVNIVSEITAGGASIGIQNWITRIFCCRSGGYKGRVKNRGVEYHGVVRPWKC